MPAALTEFLNNANFRNQADLANVTQVRMKAALTVIGSGVTTELRAQYSSNGGANWSDLGASANTPAVVIGNTVGLKVGTWVNVAAGAKADVLLRVMGINGNGTADPNFNKVVLEFR